MILSIGMIVKNEEKYLDRCLSALYPLLNNLDCELIIVDTGSTDTTIEIAKKYTSKVFNFTWCDDFSKARNETIKYAKGMWYMFLDADEILKNSDELIKLFKSKELNNYNSIVYTLHNYEDINSDMYRISTPCRIFKMKYDTKFRGVIHESIDADSPTLILKNTIFDHFGYLSDNSEVILKKIYRNISLLNKQIESGHDDSRLRTHLADCYIALNDKEKSIACIKSGLKMAKEKHSLYKPILYANLFFVYLSHEMFDSIICESSNYFNKSSLIATDIDIYYLLSVASFSLKNYRECISNYDKYIDLKTKYENNNLDTSELLLRSLNFIDERSLLKIKLYASISYSKINNKELAKKFLDLCLHNSVKKYNLSDIYIKANFEFMKLDDNYTSIEKLYINYIENDSSILENEIEKFVIENICERRKVYNAFNKLDSKYHSTIYFKLMNIRDKDYSKSTNTVEILKNVLSDNFEIPLTCSDYIYYLIKYNLPAKYILSKLNIYNMTEYINHIETIHGNFSELILGYDFIESDIKEIYFNIEMLYYCVEKMYYLDSKSSIEIFNMYLDFMKKYINSTYKDDALPYIINTANECIVFGYTCLKAYDELNNNNQIEYVRQLKKALHINTKMKNIITILINNLEANNTTNEPSEFDLLAMTIKQNINSLIKNNQLDQAKYLLNEYKKINPSDSDIYSYENFFH